MEEGQMEVSRFTERVKLGHRYGTGISGGAATERIRRIDPPPTHTQAHCIQLRSRVKVVPENPPLFLPTRICKTLKMLNVEIFTVVFRSNLPYVEPSMYI